MLYRRACFLSAALFLLPVVSRADAPRPTLQDPEPSARPIIAVADFPGTDREMGRFFAETLLTDLTRSERLQTLERAAVQQALADIELPPDSSFAPAQARSLGSRLHADRLIVGSYLVRDDQVILNARLLDAHSGLSVPGGAMNVAGSRKSLLEVTHRLSRLLHRRVTGGELLLEEIPEKIDKTAQIEHEPSHAVIAPPQEDAALLEVSQHNGLIPVSARPGGLVAERDLAGLVSRVTKWVTPQSGNTLTLAQTGAPVSRLRALVTLVKLLVSPDDLALYRNNPPVEKCADAADIPAWGQPFVAAALDQGWLPAGQPLHGRDNANWTFIHLLLIKMPITPAPELKPAADHADLSGGTYRNTESGRTIPPDPIFAPNERYTGLIIDAGDFQISRTLDFRILDEDNHEVYPDPAHIPGIDWLEDHGMASYYTDIASAKRSGNNPLVIRAIGVCGPGQDNIVVSNESAERIREAEKRGRFLAKWAVSVIAVTR